MENFNSYVAYSGLNHAATQEGLFTEKSEKLIGTLTALLLKVGYQAIIPNEELEGQFHAFRKLVASKTGFQTFTDIPKFVVA